jgi:hypothetical protein
MRPFPSLAWSYGRIIKFLVNVLLLPMRPFQRYSPSKAHKGLSASSALNWPHRKNPSIESSFMTRPDQDGHLFPVIHPVYEGTLVGRVIGMLDYMMKGFLNGGVFYEKFVDEWRAHPNWDRMSALNQMVMFDEYVKNERLELGSGYQSFRLMIEDYLVKKKKKLTEENRTLTHDSEFFEDYTKFSNSFRIIAKQGSFKKGESLFMLDGDFDVFYTLQPDPEYQKRLDAFRLKHGRDPLGYVALDKCAKKMCQRIHDQMRHFPLFEEYFSMLNVINFFSSYFMTLKTHDTIPYFPRMTLLSLFLKSDQSCHLFPIIDVAA